MVLLDRQYYDKLLNPLKQVTVNNLFARAVIENHVDGKVYTDNTESPKTFYVVHPYGMSLLFGDYTNSGFNAGFKAYALNKNNNRNKYEWMQAFPGEWNVVLNELFKDCLSESSGKEGVVEVNTRVNFHFNADKYSAYKKKAATSGYEIIRTNEQVFNDKRGSVIPSYFWNNADDFLTRGVGFSLLCKEKVASTAYSAFVIGNKLEIGIETAEKFRGRGFAQQVCSALIDYCLSNNYEPVWACRKENTGSFHLAQKLGFEPTFELPFYRLPR
jgi:RimJ/RimL family protein N-acetyltransferase